MLIEAGRVSLYCFLFPIIVNVLFILWQFENLKQFHQVILDNIFYAVPAFYLVVNVTLRLFLTGFLYQVAVRAFFLGTVFSSGIFLAVVGPKTYTLFGWYMSVLSFFHYSEFLAIAVCNPKTLSIDSFILDHSLDYKVAAVVSWVEFFVERWFYPDLKLYRSIPTVGLGMCIFGEILRKTAMVTASSNFTHTVVSKKADEHKLVTSGVYSICRHPSYVGWFYWSIGTQMILANPFCTIAYMLASWKFFNDRITIEELTLLNFFDYDYLEYQKQVPTGLPFIKGYQLTD